MNKKVLCSVIGFLLGMSVQIGSLAYRFLFSNERDLGLLPFLSGEVSGNPLFYVYTTLCTVAVFLVSGFIVGVLYDRLERQNRALEITNRRLQDLLTRLQDSEERVRRYLEEANDAILSVDAVTGQILDVNRRAEELTGYSRTVLHGMIVWELAWEGDVASIKAVFDEAVRARAGVHRTITLHRKDGVQVVMDISASVIQFGETKILQCICRDVTEHRQLERQLFQASKLAAIGQLAAGLAHEIRNPLGSITTAAAMLAMQRGQPVHDDHLELLDVIRQEAKRLNGFLQDFLTFARPRPPRVQMHNVNTLLEELLSLLEHDPARINRIMVRRDLDINIIDVPVDADQIKQVFWNLLLNAVQAMGEEGVLTVSSKVLSNGILVSIQDSGTGIPPDKLDRIFEPFYTHKADGTGLGLSISENIVNAHGGTVRVASQVGVGSAFAVTLPRTHAKGDYDIKDQQTTARPAGEGRSGRTAIIEARPEEPWV